MLSKANSSRSFAESFISFALALTVLFSTLVLLGWILDIHALRTLFPKRPEMKANTAISFLMLVAAIQLSRGPGTTRTQRNSSRALCGFVGLFSALVLFEYATNIHLRIDELIFTDISDSSPFSPPGRFAPITALNFVFLSIAIWFDCATKFRCRVAQAIHYVVLLISLQSYLSGVIGEAEFFGLQMFIPIAVPTALSFALLSSSALLSRRDVGLMERFSSDFPSSVMARRMMISVLFIPIMIRALVEFGFEAGYYSQEISIFLQTVGIILFLSIIVVATTGALLSVEREREMFRANERKAHLEASAQRDKLIKIFRLAPTHVDIYSGPDHVFEFAHPMTEQLAGGRDIKGKKLVDVFPDVIRSGVHAMATKVYTSGQTLVSEEVFVRLPSQNGALKDYYFNITMQPDIDKDRKIQGVITFAVDVTPQVKARQVVEEASLAKSQFLTNMSHEIRTPLGVIIGFSELAVESINNPKEACNYLRAIQRNGEQLFQLLGEILDLSKIEANRMESEKIPFHLKSTLLEIEELLSLKAREKNIALEFFNSKDIPDTIVSDPMKLRQVLVNLIGNAIKFTNSGWVRVITSVKRDQENGNIIRFEIHDSGIGISDEQRDRLFKPFSQADSSMTRMFGGTGLGLMLSKQITMALGGSLELVSSVFGKGSVFAVEIPVGKAIEVALSDQSQPTDRSKAKAAKHIPNLEGMRVLLVEDSPDNRTLVSHFLLRTGASVEFAENGQIGVQKASSSPYDVVLMDIQMPVLDGHQATGQLRARGYAGPIIALTAHAVREEKERALRSGFNDYLTKPITKDALFTTLERFFRRGNQHHQPMHIH